MPLLKGYILLDRADGACYNWQVLAGMVGSSLGDKITTSPWTQRSDPLTVHLFYCSPPVLCPNGTLQATSVSK
jgi:hypothetical protein